VPPRSATAAGRTSLSRVRWVAQYLAAVALVAGVIVISLVLGAALLGVVFLLLFHE